MDAQAIAFKQLQDESLGKIISILFFGVNLEDIQPSFWIALRVVNVGPEEMVLDTEILGSSRDALVCCQKVGTLVVFKNLAQDGRMASGRDLEEVKNINNQTTNRNQCSESVDQTNILSLEGA